MPLRLYNSLTKREEDFVPAHPPEVTMYTCGPTVYGRPHIGNYTAFLMADLLRRWLEAGHHYNVKHVKNITDVGHLLHDSDEGDDKVQKEAEKEKVHPLEIAKKYTDLYLEDESALHLEEPFARPRATEYVAQMREIIEGLLKAKNAYVTDDGIYFDVTSFPHYGALSGNTLDKVNAGARVQVDEKKKHPADFALWKFCVGPNAHHVLRWPSPKVEGEEHPEGFPGWHIECSAMSRALLGDQIDLHTGGEDNIFPHHECEIAQSECFTGKSPFVRTWLHKRYIEIALDEKGEDVQKMSKSLGNVLNIPDICAQGFSPLDIRYLALSVHYRTRLRFTWKALEDAKKSRSRLMEWMREMQEYDPKFSLEKSALDAKIILDETEKFSAAMDSDLNTPAALAVIFDMLSVTRTHALPTDTLDAIHAFLALVQKTFGCFEEESAEIPAEVASIVSEREQARASKNFAESDRLRAEIEKRGFIVKDTKDGQRVRKR